MKTPTTNGLSPLATWSGTSAASAIAFIDTTVTDYQTLVAGIAPDTEVHLLNSSQDAVTQITNTLLSRHNVSSIHIVSHGEAGGLDFGVGKLNLSGLSTFTNQIQSWKQALTDDADILLYGCEVAQGELGKAFVSILSQLTGADVAASDDLTGSASKSGDWTLEYQTGEIESELAWQVQTLAHYSGVLTPTHLSNFSFPTNGSNPYNLTNLNGTLYFTASDSTNGYELWKSDGTAAGTVLTKDIYPGSNSSNPTNLSALDANHLLFFADDSVNGNELWIEQPNVAPTLTVSGTALSYTENDPATPIDTTATVTDFDSTDFDTGTLTVN
ncbi:MAG: DUF4347 domain-containing protein [Stenomitos rutilans HA7619-LM2]|nr:DUF4347 domain-containing protein [Stenomitos rutilans HA7619-LM2]